MSSSTIFPATKFSPRTAGAAVLHRRRSLDSLTDGGHRPVTIVRGFPGSGKTTLVADWAQRWVDQAPSRRATVWISCDEGDQEPLVLWSGIITALQGVTSFGPDDHPVRGSGWTPDHSAAAVVNSLMEDSGRRQVDEVVVVLDEAERAGDAIATLAPLVERVPRGVRIIFTSRTDVPLPLQQLRVRRMLWELRQADLDLSLDESRAFIEIIERHATGDGPSGSSAPSGGGRPGPPPPNDRTLRDLHQLTAGWLAPYVLALADGGRRFDELLATDPETRSGGMTLQLDEFFRESFGAQSQTLQSFLLDVALLGECTPADCRAIVDSHNGDELLRAAEARGLFVQARTESNSYRLHELFRRFLRTERGRRSSRPDIELHRRAASWYGSEGSHGLAVRHHVAAGDIVAALRVIGVQMWNTGLACGVDQLKEWLAELDDNAVRGARSAEASAVYGLALVASGDAMRGKQWLTAVEGPRDEPVAAGDPDGAAGQGAVSGIDSKGVRQIVSLGWLASAWREGDVAAAVGHLHELRELRNHAVRWPSVLESLLAIEVSTWCGDFDEAREMYERRGGGTGGSSVDDVFATSVVAYTAAVEGRLSSAVSLAESALDGAAALDVSHCWPMDAARRALGVAAYEQGRFDEAREILAGLVRDAAGVPSEMLLTRAALARVELALGQVGTAMSTLKTPTGVPLVDDGSPLRDHLLSVDVRAAMAVGDLARAHDLIDHVRQPGRRSTLQARVALASSRLGEAEAAVEDLAAGTVAETPRVQVDLLVIRARLARKRRDEAQAERWVAEAVERSVAETLVRPFFEDGPELWPTLRRVLSSWPHQRFHDVALEMATRGRSERRFQPESHGTDTSQSPLAPLRPREIEVLRLIGQRLSNAEIAAALFISPNTLKTHTRSLYRKLGVTRRVEAIEVAERFHLY